MTERQQLAWAHYNLALRMWQCGRDSEKQDKAFEAVVYFEMAKESAKAADELNNKTDMQYETQITLKET